MANQGNRLREIPYNYTSFSDKEIILKYFDEETWKVIEELRDQRKTGRSAKLLYGIIGDICIIERNPYLFEDFLTNAKKLLSLKTLHQKRIASISENTNDNQLAQHLLLKTIKLNENFFASFAIIAAQRRRVLQTLKKYTAESNIKFSPFHRVSHATDATDWRVEYPFAVVYPDASKEVPGLVNAAKECGLSIIARGGGTGLTGGAVPLQKNTMIINTEKLTGITAVKTVRINDKDIPVIGVEAGVVTDKIINHCEDLGYVFATDPTSAWASTIGGNIAENAGGKKCVMWGTAIDNLYSFTIAVASGEILNIVRVDHPYRKILPEDTAVFDVMKLSRGAETFMHRIEISGNEIRKKGLGKDITNKALGGLPGVQKEGGDGVILAAEFVLYKPFNHCKTLCIEFFGNSMLQASQAIVAINKLNESNEKAYLTALEHFDQKYVHAIQYRNKSNRIESPKAVLIIDAESNDPEVLETMCQMIVELLPRYNSVGVFANDGQEQKKFWNDRKHLGAIAKHTNAFKLNEDVVIPVEKLPEFADFIELMNFVYELRNNVAAAEKLIQFFKDTEFVTVYPEKRISASSELLSSLHRDYTLFLTELEQELRYSSSGNISKDENTQFRKLQNGEVVFAFASRAVQAVKQIFQSYDEVLARIDVLVLEEQKRRIVVATHMHAGDGNVHVNIPVHSSDYTMMLAADEAATIAMQKAVQLGGVVSGEHGIGLTKLKFIEQGIIDDYQAYKKLADPENIFNPGKLDKRFPMNLIYTPSFNLLECEAIILESTDLEKLNTAIASCVRCGKCKTVCNTHYPRKTMLYNPRNKILAVGLITEAILFSAQTLDMRSFIHFKKMREISDHCTVCHKCSVPCPVKIDFGNVSLRMREQLVHRKKSAPKIMTNAALFYLTRKKYFVNKVFRLGLLKTGYSAQRLASKCHKPVSGLTASFIPKLGQLLKNPFPVSGQPSIREVFGLKNTDTFYSFANPDMEVKGSVVYFPGCGSERMFADISFATLALLYNRGIRVVIPNEYLCCGYPFLANGKTVKSALKTYENRVLFHRLAESVGYMNIDAVVISCGTCYNMLETYELEKIFPGSKLIDINEYLVHQKLYKKIDGDCPELFYHEPCHNPLKHFGTKNTFAGLYVKTAVEIPECCGEAGTLALSRPDISNTLKNRKLQAVKQFNTEDVQILTTCPSCVSGLCKLSNGRKIEGKSLAVYNAEQFLGRDWKERFISNVKLKGIERIVL
ncbi:MAG: DUF3683 domain-containing protein [Ignavibacteriales bacterium]|nr:DUF3683 domain-containing protein [Ignavibacteriales bacterium]